MAVGATTTWPDFLPLICMSGWLGPVRREWNVLCFLWLGVLGREFDWWLKLASTDKRVNDGYFERKFWLGCGGFWKKCCFTCVLNFFGFFALIVKLSGTAWWIWGWRSWAIKGFVKLGIFKDVHLIIFVRSSDNLKKSRCLIFKSARFKNLAWFFSFSSPTNELLFLAFDLSLSDMTGLRAAGDMALILGASRNFLAGQVAG